jgi:hypothetical protein
VIRAVVTLGVALTVWLFAGVALIEVADGQPAAHCHADIVDQTRHTATIDIRSTDPAGRCRIVTAHRCGRVVTMRRSLTLRGVHRIEIGVDCGRLRLRALTAEVRT